MLTPDRLRPRDGRLPRHLASKRPDPTSASSHPRQTCVSSDSRWYIRMKRPSCGGSSSSGSHTTWSADPAVGRATAPTQTVVAPHADARRTRSWTWCSSPRPTGTNTSPGRALVRAVAVRPCAGSATAGTAGLPTTTGCTNSTATRQRQVCRRDVVRQAVGQAGRRPARGWHADRHDGCTGMAGTASSASLTPSMPAE
jgi:hypothetical protein